jgi:hypothetical protein
MNRALSVRVRAAAAGPWQAALAPGARAGGAMVGPKHGDCEGPWRARTVPCVPAKQPRAGAITKLRVKGVRSQRGP